MNISTQTPTIINLRATGAAALIVESRAARTKAKIDMGDFSAALDDIQRLRHLAFDADVSAFVRAEAKRHANELTALALRVRHPEPTGAA